MTQYVMTDNSLADQFQSRAAMTPAVIPRNDPYGGLTAKSAAVFPPIVVAGPFIPLAAAARRLSILDACHLEVVVGLQAQPVVLRGPERFAEAQGRFRADGSLPEDDLVDSPRRNAQAPGERVLADPGSTQPLPQDVSWMHHATTGAASTSEPGRKPGWLTIGRGAWF